MVCCLFVSSSVAQPTFSDGREALNSTAALPFISVEGNRFVDPAGVPVHPAWWREHGSGQYLEWIDQAVQWSTELGLYVIIDWHTIGNLLSGIYHRETYVTSRDETFRFWHTIAERYRGNSTVAFYELVNEPTNRGGDFGRMPWRDYKAMIEDLIYMIYQNDDTVIPLVAGFNWGYDLPGTAERTIRALRMRFTVKRSSRSWKSGGYRGPRGCSTTGGPRRLSPTTSSRPVARADSSNRSCRI